MNPFTLFFSLSLFLLLIGCTNETNQIYEKTTKKSFQDVLQDAEFAITENNFRITNRLHIGKAIKERGNADFPQNEIILFCNLKLAKEMLKIEPRYINFCPYKITVTESGDIVTVGTRFLPSITDNAEMDNISKDINTILNSVVEYAASDDPFIFDQD